MQDPAVDLWALDEVHFQQQGSRCRMWVPPETKDPVVYHHPTRKSVGYFAAVRLRDGEFLFRRESGKFNGESFWEFLKVFREASAVAGRRVLAISDNAQYHRAKLHLEWRVHQATNFGLDFCNGPHFLDKYFAFLRWWAALKMKESQCPERERVTHPV